MVALSSRTAWAHAVKGRGLATGLCTPQENLPQKHRQDAEKHDPSASVEAEVDAFVSTATFSYSRLGRA